MARLDAVHEVQVHHRNEKMYHSDFETDLDYLKKHLNTPIIVDGRNVWDRNEALEKGFIFRGVGIPR